MSNGIQRTSSKENLLLVDAAVPGADGKVATGGNTSPRGKEAATTDVDFEVLNNTLITMNIGDGKGEDTDDGDISGAGPGPGELEVDKEEAFSNERKLEQDAAEVGQPVDETGGEESLAVNEDEVKEDEEDVQAQPGEEISKAEEIVGQKKIQIDQFQNRALAGIVAWVALFYYYPNWLVGAAGLGGLVVYGLFYRNLASQMDIANKAIMGVELCNEQVK